MTSHLGGLPVEELLIPLSGLSVGLIAASVLVRARGFGVAIAARYRQLIRSPRSRN